MFWSNVQFGFEHILDIDGIDHMLFLIVLTVRYFWEQWKQVAILVTAFTLGHCLTLILSVNELLTISSDIIEFLIALTIFCAAIYNLSDIKVNQRVQWLSYLVAGFFGLIHGIGLSNALKAIFSGEEDFLITLLSFNIGIELGQIIIVLGILIIGHLVTKILERKWWVYGLSGIALIWSLQLMVETKFW